MIKTIWKTIASKLFWGLFRHFLSDKLYAKVRYRLEMDRPLNLASPKRFTEKIQYIKLYERTNLRQQVADRTQVREYVARKAGEEYLIPLLGVFDELTPENWENLPSQFVLKANHGCGMLEIVKDKDRADYQTVRKKSERWKSTNYYRIGREWVYKDIPRTIVAEKLILDSSGSIPSDYKFFCFDGQVEVIQVDIGRFNDQKRNLYDRNFNRLQAKLLYPNFEGSPDKPARLDEAIDVAEKLSAGFNFIRVDLYVLENHVYFGELTNYPGNGFIPFEPDEMEYKMGSLLKL